MTRRNWLAVSSMVATTAGLVVEFLGLPVEAAELDRIAPPLSGPDMVMWISLGVGGFCCLAAIFAASPGGAKSAA